VEWKSLEPCQFNPRAQLKRDSQSLWQLEDHNDLRSVRLGDALRNCFHQRNEDPGGGPTTWDRQARQKGAGPTGDLPKVLDKPAELRRKWAPVGIGFSESPAQDYKRCMKRHPTYSRRPLSDAAVQALLDRAKGEWEGLILMGLHTGQRLQDIVRLSWQCVDLKRNSIRFHVAKTQRTCAVAISAVLRGHLITLPKPSGPGGPVFPKSTRRTLAELKRQFKGLATAAGTEAWGFEALRFTCWWRCQFQSLPPTQVMEMVKRESDEVRPPYDQSDTSTLEKKRAHSRDAKTGRGPPPHPKSD